MRNQRRKKLLADEHFATAKRRLYGRLKQKVRWTEKTHDI